MTYGSKASLGLMNFRILSQIRRSKLYYAIILLSFFLLAQGKIINDEPFENPNVLPSDLQADRSVLHLKGNIRERLLCRVFRDKNCHSYYIADVADLFWVIAPIYSSNIEKDILYYHLHDEFKYYIQSFGLPFITIEAIRLPNQNPGQEYLSKEPKEFTMTKPNNEPYDMQVFYYNVTYIRENLLNVALRKLEKLAPWEYVVWIDAHQNFVNTLWWEESIYKAEKFGAVQLFDKVVTLTPKNHTSTRALSIIRLSLFTPQIDHKTITFGNAYALNRERYYRLGSIYDECIATSCDCAYVIGSFPPGVGWELWAPMYYKNFDPWIENARKVFNGSRTYVRGSLYHYAHGTTPFPYIKLQTAVEEFGFNATQDIRRDSNYSIYLANDQVGAVLEWIIFKSKLD